MGKLHGIGVGNDFMNVTPKAQATRANIEPKASALESKQPPA